MNGKRRWMPAHLRQEAAHLASLAAALWATNRWASPVSGAAGLAVLVLAALLPARKASAETRPLRRLAARAPSVAVVAAGAAVLFRVLSGLPWASLVFVPLWIGAELLLDTARMAPWVAILSRAFRWALARWEAIDDAWLGQAALLAAAAYVSGRIYPEFWHWPLCRAHAVAFGWAGAALAAYRVALKRLRLRDGGARSENFRWILLGAAALTLMRGITRFTAQGTGDAVWYATMLADMVAQVRAGVFPVWLGQSVYQFNGSIFPIRIAPAFHYLGAALDAATFHSLGTFALQNLLLTLIGVAGIYSAYFSLGSLMAQRRWHAAALAFVFLACPGVMGLAYNTDLFMSWTALPWIPLVWAATVRSFRDGGRRRTMIFLGGALGLCWWCHSPIALWMTLCAAAAQTARLLAQRPQVRAWLDATAGSAAFAAIAAYPIGSVLAFRPDPTISATAFQGATAFNIAYFLRQVFPAVILPVSWSARQLGDFQLGYALWAVFLLGIWRSYRAPHRECVVLFGLAAAIVILLSPIPGVDLALWSALPGFIRDSTGNWAMNRLYLVLAGAIVTGFAGADIFPATARGRWIGALLAVCGCAWSFREASKFADESMRPTPLSLRSAALLLPENAMITRNAYTVFPRLPASFSHGATDPELENRLWSARTGALLVDNLAAARALAVGVGASGYFLSPPPDHWLELRERPRIESGRHYLLAFDFVAPAQIRGVLQIAGSTLFREYALPEYGEAQSFGVGGLHTNLLPVWTSSSKGENLTIRYFPDSSSPTAEKLFPLGRVTWMEYESARLPVQVLSWLPSYRARVAASEDAWLETPRMYQRGYAAWVDGRPADVRKSIEGLVEVRVPPGNSEVDLRYRAPFGLAFLFWASLAAIAAWLLHCLIRPDARVERPR